MVWGVAIHLSVKATEMTLRIAPGELELGEAGAGAGVEKRILRDLNSELSIKLPILPYSARHLGQPAPPPLKGQQQLHNEDGSQHHTKD